MQLLIFIFTIMFILGCGGGESSSSNSNQILNNSTPNNQIIQEQITTPTNQINENSTPQQNNQIIQEQITTPTNQINENSTPQQNNQTPTTPINVVEEKIYYFIDSPVKGLEYSCGENSGITDEKGAFKCKMNSSVIFKVGNLTVGTLNQLPSDDKVFPHDIYGVARNNITNDNVIELSRFLQSLDDDGNIDHHINITPTLKQTFTTNEKFEELDKKAKFQHIIERGKSYRTREEVKVHLKTSLQLRSSSLIEEALKNANASVVSENEIVDEISHLADDESNYCKATLDYSYPNGLEMVTLPSRSAYFETTSSKNLPFHASKTNGTSKVYSWIGTKSNDTRYAVIGTNIFTFEPINTQLKDSTLNLFNWLLKQESSNDILSQNLKIGVPNRGIKSHLEAFISKNNLSNHWTITSDINDLNSANYDIYISLINDDMSYVEKAINAKKPVLVYQEWYQPSDEHLAYFNLKWSWYGEATIGNFENTSQICDLTLSSSAINKTVQNLHNNALNFNYTDTACPSNVGKVTCDENKLLNANGKTLGEEFTNGAKGVKNILASYDNRGVNLFKSDDETIIKLAVLLADKYRANISYPMDKVSTDESIFYKSLFADYTVHYMRDNNPVQPNLGDYTTNLSAIRALTTLNESLTLTPTPYSEWTSSLVYAPPAKMVTVKRTDNSTNVIKIRINMLREDSSRIWNSNHYTRPKFMTSAEITLEKDKEYNLSTPYGGAIYVYSQGVEVNAQPFTLEFKGILKHPTLSNFDNESIAKFMNELENSPFDWVDIKTPFVEIHSLKSKMREAFSTGGSFPYNNNVELYFKDLKKYLIDNNLNLAGFKGDGLALNSSVAGWCSDNNLDCTSDIHKKPAIQHINSDINAHCGGGCSGNPYDASWGITPTGWGDNHEFGHNLQVGRLKIYGGKSTEVSNNIFPLYSNWSYINDHDIAIHPDTDRPNTTGTFDMLYNQVKKATPANESHRLWSGNDTYSEAGERLSFYQQLVFTHGSWDIYTKLYLLNRLFADAIKNDTNWSANRDKLGFSGYTRIEANTINGNDFMAIILSKFTGKNHIDYFTMWGIEISDKAKLQIATNGFSSTIQKEYFLPLNNYITKFMPTKTLTLDGTDINTTAISGICTSQTLSTCSNISSIYTVKTPASGSLYFLSKYADNGNSATSSISNGAEGYTMLTTTATDDLGNSKTVYLRASKTTSDVGIDGTKVAMNDTTASNGTNTSLIVWIDPIDNTFESERIYSFKDNLTLLAMNEGTMIGQIILKLSPIKVPSTLMMSNPNSAYTLSYPIIENSSTYFVAQNASQGATSGIWSYASPTGLLSVKVKDESGASYTMKLRAKRDGYRSAGTSGYDTDMNSGGIWGGYDGNALIVWYNSADNPTLPTGHRYTSSEMLAIDAKLWHQNSKLRDTLYVSVDFSL